MESSVLASRIITKEELCLLEQKPGPCGVVIFGASGDLTQRKLLPALFYLTNQNLMPNDFYVLGVARTEMTDEGFRKKVRNSIPSESRQEDVENFLNRCFYIHGDYNNPSLYKTLNTSLRDLDKKRSIQDCHVFYLSTPSSLYSDIVDHLGQSGLVHSKTSEKEGWTRVIIEKPFGRSLKSSQELNKRIHRVLTEGQIYRIDHYLAKETVQNILMFRFANTLFEPVWNRNFIDHVQVMAAEQLGVEHRAGYYEDAGVLRDMFQNHLLQLLSIVAMEAPCSLEANAVRNRRIDVLNSVRPMTKGELERNTVCGQYGPGTINGKTVPGYREEKGVKPDSRTATFAAVKFELDNWRWQGVPFYIRSGKRLADRVAEIAVHFKHVPTSIFKPLLADQLSANILKFRIQPDEGISMRFEAKHPGPKLCMSTVTMNFGYRETFKIPPPDAYARLFQDSMLGDQTLFARNDSVEKSWRIIDPICDFWESNTSIPVPIYPSGSWGPNQADILLNQSGRSWN